MTLKRFVNDREEYRDFTEMLEKKIQHLYKRLEQAKDIYDVYRIQGEIYALQKLKMLKEELKDNSS